VNGRNSRRRNEAINEQINEEIADLQSAAAQDR